MKNIILCVIGMILCSTQLSGQQKKSITDTIFSLKQVDVNAKIKRVNLLNINAPMKFVPMTVSTLPAEMLERKGIFDLEEAVRFLPGITVSDQLGAFQRYSIRGVSDAVVMIDGFRDERSLLNTAPFGDLSSVESIELIKGPASVLSGHSAMGGVLNIIRKKVSPDFSANARLSYGSWKMKQATVGFGGKLVGPVEYRTNFHYSTGDGYRKVKADRFSGMAALGANLWKTGRLDVTVGFSDDDFTTEIGAAPLMPGNILWSETGEEYAKKGDRHPEADYHAVYGDFANNYMNRKSWDVAVQYGQELTKNLKVREKFTYNHSDLDYHALESVGYRESENPVYKWYYLNSKNKKVYIDLDTLQSPMSTTSPLNFNPDHKMLENNLEFTGDITTGFIKHHFIVGWAYSSLNFTQYNGYNKGDLWGPGLGALVSVRDPHLVRPWWDCKVSAATIRIDNTHGIYLHDVMELSDKWKVMLAGRMDIYKTKNATATISDGRQHYDRENRTDWKKVSTSAFTYRAGVVYLPHPSVSLYGSMSSFFKPIRTVYNPKNIYLDRDGNEFNPDKEGGEVFKPERGYSAEIGVRYTLNRMLELNGSIFYIRKLNIVKNLGDTTVVEEGVTVAKTIQGQVGTADSRGFDIEIIVRPVSTLQITGGLGWSDYRIRDIRKSDIFPDVEKNKNLRATGIPRTTFYAYVDYTIPKGILKELSFHLSGNFKDKVYKNIADNTYFPSLWLMDAGVFYTIKRHVNLAVNVNNLFNKEYFTRNTVLGKPRNYMASVSYTF